MYPAGQVMQLVEPRENANSFAPHAWHPDAPVAFREYVPTGHGWHAAADDAPAVAEYVPSGHGSQSVALYEPTIGEKRPARHCVHTLCPSRFAYVPAVHVSHAVRPAQFEAVPTLQSVHADAAAHQNVPAVRQMPSTPSGGSYGLRDAVVTLLTNDEFKASGRVALNAVSLLAVEEFKTDEREASGLDEALGIGVREAAELLTAAAVAFGTNSTIGSDLSERNTADCALSRSCCLCKAA
jgi:hypothetical protein